MLKENTSHRTILFHTAAYGEGYRLSRFACANNIENPSNINARIHLARVLSWQGRLKSAMEEIEIVLRDQPENRDALLVKANILTKTVRETFSLL